MQMYSWEWDIYANGVFNDIFGRTYSLDQKKKIYPKRHSVSMQIRPNFHNLCKCIHENWIFHENGVLIDIFEREHIPWNKRRKFIKRDTLFICKLGLISLTYANVLMGMGYL